MCLVVCRAVVSCDERIWGLVHALYGHAQEGGHVGSLNGQRSGWSERLCSAFRIARGRCLCFLVDDSLKVQIVYKIL